MRYIVQISKEEGIVVYTLCRYTPTFLFLGTWQTVESTTNAEIAADWADCHTIESWENV